MQKVTIFFMGVLLVLVLFTSFAPKGNEVRLVPLAIASITSNLIISCNLLFLNVVRERFFGTI